MGIIEDLAKIPTEFAESLFKKGHFIYLIIIVCAIILYLVFFK